MAGIAPRIDYFTASDGYRIASRVWEADNPIGRIVYVHGMISHSGWYLKSCRHFASQGFEVHFPDRRGSGLNMQSRGDAPGHEVLLDDVEQYLTSLTGNLPTILIGVSWGGKFAAAFAVVVAMPYLLYQIWAFVAPGLLDRERRYIPAILIVGVPGYRLGVWRERRRWEGSKLVLENVFTNEVFFDA